MSVKRKTPQESQVIEFGVCLIYTWIFCHCIKQLSKCFLMYLCVLVFLRFEYWLLQFRTKAQVKDLFWRT